VAMFIQSEVQCVRRLTLRGMTASDRVRPIIGGTDVQVI
jgi:hypothetical protein